MTKFFEPHPAAALMPLMDAAQLKTFTEDIRRNGQVHPAVIHDGLLLDGRNRQEACRALGVELKTVPWNGKGGSPAAYVVSTNVERRHLKAAQKAVIAVKLLPLFKAEAKQRQLEAARRPRGKKGAQSGPPTKRKATVEVARAVDVGSRSVEAAASIQKSDPKIFQALADGEMTLSQARRSVNMKIARDQARDYVPPAGEFEVITVDYPWKYDDQLDGAGARGGCQYPPMTVREICEFPIPAAKDCALFMWVTNSHLIDPNAYAEVAKALLVRYGFIPKALRTWEKDRMGLGRYWRNDTEQLVLFVRGYPVFNEVTQRTSFLAPRGQHSEKPQKAYDDIAALCASPSRLEMFAVRPRDGWAQTGSALAPVAASDEASPPGSSGHNESSTLDDAFSQSGDPGTSLEGRVQLAKAVAEFVAPGQAVEIIVTNPLTQVLPADDIPF